MQSLRFSGFPTVHPSFQRHRKSIDHPRFTLKLSVCSTNNPPIWASLPTPPMSGSPPPEPSTDPSQLAGRRRKRSDSPPTTTTTSAVGTQPVLAEQTAPRYGERPPSERRRTDEDPRMQLAAQPLHYLPPLGYGAGPGVPLTQYSPPGVSSTQQQISPRTTRKTKAHVASACINCKKKHLRCDNTRPCRRCVQSGKEETCRDVEHKKRGRPPLKPEDPTAMARRTTGTTTALGPISDPSRVQHGADQRGYAPSNYPPILPNAPPSMYAHQRSGSRSLYTGLQSPYAPPSVAPSPLTASGAFSYSNRPQSTSSTVSTQPPSPYVSHPTYTGQGMQRQTQSFTGYPFHPIDIPPSTQPYYSNPIFPREQLSHMPNEMQYGHGLQLPPIRPTQSSMIDPSISRQRSPVQQQPAPDQRQSQRQESGERDPKRPKMDIQGILGPKND